MTTIDLKKSERDIDVVVQRKVKNEMLGKRYFVAELVKKALDKYFKYEEIVVSNEYSLYKFPLINEELNIVDFEINSLSVHVIPTFDKGKNANVYIPSLYKQYHFKPDMFLFVNFSKTFAKMEILGFIIEPDLNMRTLPKAILSSPDSLVNTIETLVPRQNKISSGTIETTKELMLAYFENDLSEEGKRFFLKNMITSKEVRENYKLFYSLNSDFYFISKDNSIEKINPAEKRIELFSRSDYLIDKAISKYKEEDTDTTEDNPIETNDNIENYQQENLDFADVNSEVENVLQLSLAPLNLEEDEQEEILEDISDEQFIEQNDSSKDEDSQQEELQLLEEENISDENDELSLEDTKEEISDEELISTDDELMDLSETDLEEEDLLDSEEINLADANDNLVLDEENRDEILEETFEADMEELPQEEELVDISETGEDVDDLLDESFPDAVELEEDNDGLNENQEIEAQDEPEEEDLFAFLSEISEEEIEANTNANSQVQPIQAQSYYEQEEQLPPQEEYISQTEEYVAQVAPNVMEQPVYQQNYQNTQTQTTVAPQKPKSNTKMMLVVFVCLCLLGAYQYKDQILPMIPTGNDETASTGVMIDNSKVTAPIDTAKLAENATVPSATVTTPSAPATQQDATAKQTENATAPVKVENNKLAENLPALPATVEPPKPKHLNDAIATALTKDFSGVRISKLSWEISETLVANPEVKRYLTIAGKSIKNALAQDLLAATEPSFNDKIVVNIIYRKDGSVAKVDISSSSGSKQIDDIITKSVKDTLNYVKMPAMNLTNSEYSTKINIRL